jgi:hypothetical protein
MPLFPKCFFFHNWTKWERKTKRFNRARAGVWQKGPDGKLLVHESYHLERTCETCGVVERRDLDNTED